MTAGFQDATFFAQVDPEWRNYYGQEPTLVGARVVTITQKRPRKPKGGTVLVKLTIRVPDAAFLPLRPEAIVVVPEDMTVVTPLEVEASDPS